MFSSTGAYGEKNLIALLLEKEDMAV